MTRTEANRDGGILLRALLAGVVLCLTTVCNRAQSAASDTEEWLKPVPVSFVLDFSLWSDFICRKSINLSEYPGEGREDLNYQVWIALSLSSKDFLNADLGKFSIGFWADWFAGQEHVTPNHDGDLNEWDIIPSWALSIPRTPVTLSLAYDYWVLPPYNEDGASHDRFSGHELWVTLAFDDSAVFGRPVFSPYVLWVRDIDDYQENWIDIGVSHTIAPASLGCAHIPMLRHVSIIPKIVMGIDDGYVDAVLKQQRKTRFASVNYSLTAAYDLGAALGVRPAQGGVCVRGFIHFKDQVDDYDAVGFYPVLRDEVYGGFGITYSW